MTILLDVLLSFKIWDITLDRPWWNNFLPQSKWTFKLRVTVARACVSSARSIKLVNDVELVNSEGPRAGQAAAPLLVVGAGKAYAITDAAPKKTIMSVVQKVSNVFHFIWYAWRSL